MGDMDHWNRFPRPAGIGPWPESYLRDLEEFFRTEDTRPPGLDIYEDVFQTHLFFPLQRKRELEKAVKYVRSQMEPNVVMEIGADKGAGFYHWCKCFLAVEKAIALEVRGCPYANLFEEHFGGSIDFLWCEASSTAKKTIESVKTFLGSDTIDVLFIDGDKNKTREDFEAYAPMMTKGGVVMIHDIKDDPPGVTFDALVGQYPSERIIDMSENDEAVERAASGIPADTSYEDWLRYWAGRSCGVGILRL